MADNFERAFILRRVLDGDTLEAESVDLGYHVHASGVQFRLLRVNAPEVHGASKPAGVVATGYTRGWLAEHVGHGGLFARTQLTDSFGRYLAEVSCGQGHNLSDGLLASGNAVPFKG